MDTMEWIALAGGVAVVGYLLVMRVFFRQSKAVDKTTDYSKIKPLKDDDE
jgi:hypothetical protein